MKRLVPLLIVVLIAGYAIGSVATNLTQSNAIDKNHENHCLFRLEVKERAIAQFEFTVEAAITRAKAGDPDVAARYFKIADRIDIVPIEGCDEALTEEERSVPNLDNWLEDARALAK